MQPPQKTNVVQVTLQCSQENLAVFQDVAAKLGVNRQQLFREALDVYASMLKQGVRTWKDPTLTAQR